MPSKTQIASSSGTRFPPRTIRTPISCWGKAESLRRLTAERLYDDEDSDGNRLRLIAPLCRDSGNNRVLVWNPAPISSTRRSEFAIGQANLTSGGAATNATGLSSPMSVFSDGTRLIIGDNNNSRVLIGTAFQLQTSKQTWFSDSRISPPAPPIPAASAPRAWMALATSLSPRTANSSFLMEATTDYSSGTTFPQRIGRPRTRCWHSRTSHQTGPIPAR